MSIISFPKCHKTPIPAFSSPVALIAISCLLSVCPQLLSSNDLQQMRMAQGIHFMQHSVSHRQTQWILPNKEICNKTIDQNIGLCKIHYQLKFDCLPVAQLWSKSAVKSIIIQNLHKGYGIMQVIQHLLLHSAHINGASVINTWSGSNFHSKLEMHCQKYAPVSM